MQSSRLRHLSTGLYHFVQLKKRHQDSKPVSIDGGYGIFLQNFNCCNGMLVDKRARRTQSGTERVLRSKSHLYVEEV